MTTNLSQPASLGVLSKLPPELRGKTYLYHLVLHESIPMIPCLTPSSVRSHLADCKTNSHFEDHRMGVLKCINHSSGETQLISCPSRLALLATSRAIYNEAVHIYYSENHLIFDSVARLQKFITCCRSRYRFMGEISFRYCLINWNSDVFRALIDCQHLRIMRIEFHHRWVSYGERTSLVRAAGMNSLRNLRGIKILELSGKDQIYIGEGNFAEVDVDDSRAVGPILRSELTRPRE